MTCKIGKKLHGRPGRRPVDSLYRAAQGGGASSTGTIQGRAADGSGAVLPGVTVTATSPSMIGAQTQITNENGTYRFPAVPPGEYSLTFELSGFSTVKRDGIQSRSASRPTSTPTWRWRRFRKP